MSYSPMRPDGFAVAPVIEADGTERVAFIRKVYALVFLGVSTFFAGIVALYIGWVNSVPVIGQLAELSFTLHPLLVFGLLIGASILVHSVEMVRVVNLVAMLGFCLFFSWLSVPLIAYALGTAGFGVILLAGGITTMVFGGLTAYTFITRTDFSFMGAALSMGVFLLLGAILVTILGQMFFGIQMEAIHVGMSIFAVILFSGFVLYDTSNVMNKYALDMAVPAALALTIDFIILFRNILYLLMAARR